MRCYYIIGYYLPRLFVPNNSFSIRMGTTTPRIGTARFELTSQVGDEPLVVYRQSSSIELRSVGRVKVPEPHIPRIGLTCYSSGSSVLSGCTHHAGRHLRNFGRHWVSGYLLSTPHRSDRNRTYITWFLLPSIFPIKLHFEFKRLRLLTFFLSVYLRWNKLATQTINL